MMDEFCNFIGEIDGGNCPLNGEALTPSHLLFSAILNSAIMPKGISNKTGLSCKFKHGLRDHILYSVWYNIKRRCYNKKNVAYKNYGGRGISICNEWLNDFKAFYDYVSELDNYNKPGYTLDRKNNNKGYEPDNMKWSTKHEQNANQGRRKKNTTGYRGVNKWRSKYCCHITVNKVRYYLGSFLTAEDAAIVRDRFILENDLSEYPLQIINQ